MAVGQIAKQEVTKKILETFKGSFVCEGGKEIRIPMLEDGVERQIKVTLTCAKVNISPDGEAQDIPTVSGQINFTDAQTVAEALKPTAEEKENMANLLKSLGL